MTPRSWLSGRTRALAFFVAYAAAAPAAYADEPADRPGDARVDAASAAPEAAAPEAAAPADAVPADAVPADAVPADAAPADAAPVVADPTGDDDVPFVDEIVVIGRRPRGSVAADPTASATVVSADRFAGEAKGVAQLVATAPGVAVNEYGGLGHFSTVSIRGSNANGVLVLVDGLPLNTEAGGGVDLSSIPRAWIDRIEIVRGPEGAAYGAGALGGVVNVITRRAAPGHPSGEAMMGSFGTYALAAEARPGFEHGALLVAASGEASQGDFLYLHDPDPVFAGGEVELPRLNDATMRGGVLAKGRLDLGSRRLDALVHFSAGRRELAGQPYALTPGHPYALSPDDFERDARALATVRLVMPGPVRGLTLAARAHARADLLDLTRGAIVASQRDVAGGAEAEALLDHNGGAVRLALSALTERLSGDGFGEERGRASFAVAASDSMLAGPLRVGPGVRLERVGGFSGWSAKLGASTALTRWLTARVSGGRTFRAPSLAELYLQQAEVAPNPDLRSEVGLGADASLAAEGRAGFASIGTHVTRYDDLIVYRPATYGLRPFNSLRALVAGLEVEGATAPFSRLRASLQAAYTLLFTETLEGGPMTLGKELPRQPRHRVFARAAFAPGAFGAHVEAHYVSRQFKDDRNADADYPIPAATVWNAGASFRILARPPVHLALEVKNVLDDRTLLDPLAYPLPGRTVLVSARLDAKPSHERPPQ